MSSRYKTENLKLNLWNGSDSPKRTDFNYDNEVIDKAVNDHTSDKDIHIEAEERDKWTNYMYTGFYYGDGYLKRTVTTGCPFDAMVGFIYADDMPMSIHYASDGTTHHYLAIISQFVNSLGATLDKNMRDINVENSITAEIEKECSNLNETGVCYRYVLFRDNRIIESI